MLLPFFAQELIGKVRVAKVPVVPTPWFYPVLRRFGIDVPVEMSLAEAITFDDTIVVRDGRHSIRDWHSLLFHELVHVVQYSLLGPDQFIDQYVRGLVACGMDYNRNPFEREAYALQGRFDSAPDVGFSVEAEVRKSL
jgi:hypothetical protein